MNISVGVKSDVGRIRSGNEDSYLTNDLIFVVADGMGGHIAGDVASSTAVDTIKEHLGSASGSDPETLAQLIRHANVTIWEKARTDASLTGMGTTCTLVYVDGDRAHVAHVGDSRAYRLRAGALEQLTEDHTLVARMVKEGKLSPAEAMHHPQRSIITRALGVDSDVRVDLTSVELRDGDRLLLCSDGLTSMIDEDSIAEALEREQEPQAAANLLVDLANEAGGEDNVTVLIVDLSSGSAAGGSASSEAASPPPPPEPVGTDPGPAAAAPVHVVRSSRRWPRWLMVLLVIAALIAGGFLAARYALDNSWFVGVDEDDRIAIYSGIPEEIAGVQLKEKQEVTPMLLADLPEFKQAGVRDGIKVDSLDEAQTTVGNLSDLAQDFARDGNTGDGT
ncbi:MAG: Stp1/IreP family PP2C-type Ser/Thr phosphatase [Actinomycetota bacterium]